MTLDPRHQTWAGSGRYVPRVFVQRFLRFTRIEASSGIVLLAGAVLAVIWANSAWSSSYHRLFEETHLAISLGPFHFDESLGGLINDGLMCIFFFVVALEIKRELVVGELRDAKAAVLPAVAAVGGMVIPALIYAIVTAGASADVSSGWAIPMATDIAFTVGIMALLGRRVPAAAKVFLLALAIVDDLGAILVIALFYSAGLHALWMVLAVACLTLIWVAQRSGIRSLVFYVPVAIVAWFATLESGVHATLAAVALGLLTPLRPLYGAGELDRKAREILDTFPTGETPEDQEKSDHEADLLAEIATESIAPLHRLESKLVPWSSYVVVPLFALANAGVDLRGTGLGAALSDRVSVGVGLGLFVGKALGISLFTWAAVRLGLGRLPTGTRWSQLVGVAFLAGVGFTVSLFITNLAFPAHEAADVARVGIFAGSVVSGLTGAAVLLASRARAPKR